MNEALTSCKAKVSLSVEGSVDRENSSVLNRERLIVIVLVGGGDGGTGWIGSRTTRSLGAVLVLGVDARRPVHYGQLVWSDLVFLGANFALLAHFKIGDLRRVGVIAVVTGEELERAQLIARNERRRARGMNEATTTALEMKACVGIEGSGDLKRGSSFDGNGFLDAVLVSHAQRCT